jgi:ribosomal protein S18 acetylase RimI-like enzyme
MVHVQVGNDGAKAFYEGLGFKEDKVCVIVRLNSRRVTLMSRVENYYSKMEPRGATLMVLDDIKTVLGEKVNGIA